MRHDGSMRSIYIETVAHQGGSTYSFMNSMLIGRSRTSDMTSTMHVPPPQFPSSRPTPRFGVEVAICFLSLDGVRVEARLRTPCFIHMVSRVNTLHHDFTRHRHIAGLLMYRNNYSCWRRSSRLDGPPLCWCHFWREAAHTSSNSSLVPFVCGMISGDHKDHAGLGVDDNCVQCHYGQSHFLFSSKVANYNEKWVR
jgi:hypothetical protein